MLRRTIDVAPVRVGDAREKDTPRCGLCSKRLPSGHPFQYCNSCMRRLEAGEKPADIMRGAKDHVTLLPVPDGTSELRYTAKDADEVLCRWCRKPLERAGGMTTHRTREEFAACWKTRKDPAKKPAKDSSLSTGLLAALIAAIVAHFYGPEERVGPQDYDLTRYRPKRREW